MLLNQALINYAIGFLVARGSTPVHTPFFMRKVRPLKECCTHMLDAPLAHRMLTLYS